MLSTLLQSAEIQAAYACWGALITPPIRHAPPRAQPGDFAAITQEIALPGAAEDWIVFYTINASTGRQDVVIAHAVSRAEARATRLRATSFDSFHGLRLKIRRAA